MGNDPVRIWISWGCWLFGFSVRRGEIGLCVGPLNISIVPSLFRRPTQ